MSLVGRALVVTACLTAGCAREVLWWRAPPWPDDAPAVVVRLDNQDRPVGLPTILGPGDALTETLSPDVTRIWTLAYDAGARGPDGSPLTSCGASASGGTAPYPRAAAQWRVDGLDAETAEPGDLIEVPVDEAPPFQLSFERCALVRDLCAGIEVETLALPGYQSASSVMMLSDDSAWLVADSAILGSDRFKGVRLEGTGFTTLPAARLQFDGAAWDGDDTVYWVGDRGARPSSIAAFGLDGSPRPVPILPDSTADMNISARAGAHVYVTHDDGFFRFSSGSTVAEAVPGLTTRADDVHVVRDDHLVVVDGNRSLFHGDGRSFVAEYDPGLSAAARVYDVAGDDERFVAVGQFGTVLVRDAAARTWDPLPLAPEVPANLYRTVGLMAGDRMLFAVEPGLIYVWSPEGWCKLAEDERWGFKKISVASSKRVAMVVGEVNTRGVAAKSALVLRLRLPSGL